MNINQCGCRPYEWLGLDGNRCIRVIPRQKLKIIACNVNNMPLGPIVTKQPCFKQDYTNSSSNSGLGHNLTINSQVIPANVLCDATYDFF